MEKEARRRRPLEGRVAVVTGSSRGLGAEVARRLDADGASIVITYRSSAQEAEKLATMLSNKSLTVKADVSKEADAVRVFDEAEDCFGGVDIVVNNAGIIDAEKPRISEMKVEAWDEAFATNTRGTFLFCREATRRILRSPHARIVNVSGTLVATLKPGFSAYCASKASVETLTAVLSKELTGTNITVNCVAPGPMPTDMLFSVRGTPSVHDPTLCQCSDVAAIIAFLVGDDASAITGQVIRVNGGAA